MKQPKQPVIVCVLIVCITLLIFTILTRNRLCEIRVKDGNREVSAVLAYASGK
ncbi:type I toxin-antitoxin system Hok family toxin [Klebsiella aerogenes]